MAAIGDAVLIDSGPQGKHLHVIIWGPGPITWLASHDQMILVSVTTIYPRAPYDKACVLSGGEHQFIVHPSYVVYRQPRVDTPTHIDHMIASGLFVAQPAATSQLVRQMRQGFCDSKLADRRFKVLLNCPPPAPKV